MRLLVCLCVFVLLVVVCVCEGDWRNSEGCTVHGKGRQEKKLNCGHNYQQCVFLSYSICIMNFFLGQDDDDKGKWGKAGPGPHRYPLYMSFECKDCS